MGLDSLLASLKAGVAEVAWVQASRTKGIACNPVKQSEVAAVSLATEAADTATPETLRNSIEVSSKPSSTLACTHATSVTPELIEYEFGAGDTATACGWWLIHHVDREPLPVACSPEATHAQMLERHPDAVAAAPFTPTVRHPSTPMTAEEESAIRAWLERIDETDPATIAHVIGQCQRDADAQGYFAGRAADDLQRNRLDAASDDDRRTCDQCANLIGRRCQAAKHGEIAASRNYEPIQDLPRRCEGYAPGADDPDPRNVRERWLGLIQKGATDDEQRSGNEQRCNTGNPG